MSDRVKCKNKDCDHSILPETALKTGGTCMPCSQKKEREERQKYIEENRKDIDPFLGVQDSVEIIRLYHLKRTIDPLVRYASFQGNIEDEYAKLSKFDEARLIDISIQEAEKGNLDYIDYVCLELSAFNSAKLSKLHRYMLTRNIYYPSMIFKDASSDVVSELITRLNNDHENKNHILLALAWAKNKEVISTFTTWMQSPPKWANDLYIPPEGYSKDAGWEILPNQSVHNLFYDHCFSLVPNEDLTPSTELITCTISDQKCEWCGNNLTNLFELDLSTKAFDFLELSGEKVKLSTCSVCSCYSDSLYTNFDTQGNTQWSEFNSKPSYLPDDSGESESLPENKLTISSKSRPSFYAANEFLSTSFSQIGGMPTWIQDFAYPTCPSCKNTMTFFGQISTEEIDSYFEGTYYVYICKSCNISATNYQQT